MDEPLLRQVAGLTGGSQRWLKAALQAIANLEAGEPEEPRLRKREQPQEKAESPPAAKPAASLLDLTLDEVLSGESGLEQAEAYPELAQELREISEIAALLREMAAERRRLGEQILKESDWGQDAEAG